MEQESQADNGGPPNDAEQTRAVRRLQSREIQNQENATQNLTHVPPRGSEQPSGPASGPIGPNSLPGHERGTDYTNQSNAREEPGPQVEFESHRATRRSQRLEQTHPEASQQLPRPSSAHSTAA